MLNNINLTNNVHPFKIIDWDRPYICLDKELLALEKVTKNRLADTLIQVYRKDGEKELILLHVEVQGRYQREFSSRMFEYFCRLYAKHKKPIFCIAILTKKIESPPEPFRYTFGKRVFTWEYDIIKLWEQKNNPILKLSKNPFARAIEFQLAANKKPKKYENRYDNKLKLLKNVLSLDYPQKYIEILFSFVDYLFQLPKNMEIECTHEIRIYGKELNMAYVTSFEMNNKRRRKRRRN